MCCENECGLIPPNLILGTKSEEAYTFDKKARKENLETGMKCMAKVMKNRDDGKMFLDCKKRLAILNLIHLRSMFALKAVSKSRTSKYTFFGIRAVPQAIQMENGVVTGNKKLSTLNW